jgi:hypothetical protein
MSDLILTRLLGWQGLSFFNDMSGIPAKLFSLLTVQGGIICNYQS